MATMASEALKKLKIIEETKKRLAEENKDINEDSPKKVTTMDELFKKAGLN